MSLLGTYDPDNIFAKILRGDMPCVKVYEDDDVLSFMDVFPQSKGHTLVIPKVPSRNLLETDPDILAIVMKRTQLIAKAVQRGLNPDGLYIMQLNGAPAGQTVFHLHFHIIPRYEGDALVAHGSAGMADVSELEGLAKQIKTQL